MMKRQWIPQLAGIILAFLLLIFVAHTCAAQDEEKYPITEIGASINYVPISFKVQTDGCVKIDTENDIITVIMDKEERKQFPYALVARVYDDNGKDHVGTVFGAIDPLGNKYFISLRVYEDEKIQVTIADTSATAGYVLFLNEQPVSKGLVAWRLKW